MADSNPSSTGSQSVAAPGHSVRLHPFELRSFDVRWSGEIVRWVSDGQALRWLAPGTVWPLTSEKVAAWARSDGFAATGWVAEDASPIAYGEVNPMRRRKGCYWLGHVIVKPSRRGRGIGLAFVRALLHHAFENLHGRLVALIVFPDNAPAIECYLRAGFRVAGEEAHQFRQGAPQETLLRMEINRARYGPV